MWCARFLPAAGGQGGVLLLGVHHTATDGLSNIKICHFLHTILDDLTAERRVDDAEQLADHVGDEEARLLYERERQRLLHDPDLYRRRKEELMAATKVPPPILSVLSFPRNEVATTRSVKLVLDEPATQAFRQICQAEGVSLHCALTGVVNVAMLGILEALPNTPPEHNFVCSHDINLRRYYEGDTSRILGVHIATFSYKMSLVTPKDVMHKFWPYVLELHGRLREDLKDRAPLQAVALRLMERSKDDNFKECFSSTAVPEYCYAISNIGDVTSTLPGNGDFVQVTNLTWCASLRRLVTLMCFNVHTFRGKLNINLAYSTHFMGRDTAQQIVNNMHDVITSLSTKDHGARE
uniref:Phthiocerol/phthiodiolone dimycocerosyl transferase C-terminal domain-containing protein n=1 Tax=Scylla olivacea TaxID=85551 RepID=A0A0N7ZCH3_SCYOL